MQRRVLFAAMTASCLLASTAVDAQRYSAPAYRPPPPPPPSYTPPPPRYTPPPPAANQNMRQGSQSGGAYQSNQQRSSTTGSNLGGYRPGSIANSNSQSSGKLSGGASSAQAGVKGGPKSTGIGTTKQAGATGLGKASAPANDKGKAAGKSGPKVAAASAGAGLFAAGAQQAHASPKSSVDDPFRPDVKGKAKNDFNNPPAKKVVAANKDDGKKKGPRGPQDCGPGETWDPVSQRCVPKPANDLKPGQ